MSSATENGIELEITILVEKVIFAHTHTRNTKRKLRGRGEVSRKWER